MFSFYVFVLFQIVKVSIILCTKQQCCLQWRFYPLARDKFLVFSLNEMFFSQEFQTVFWVIKLSVSSRNQLTRDERGRRWPFVTLYRFRSPQYSVLTSAAGAKRKRGEGTGHEREARSSLSTVHCQVCKLEFLTSCNERRAIHIQDAVKWNVSAIHQGDLKRNWKTLLAKKRQWR